jgi:hypothetical protein
MLGPWHSWGGWKVPRLASKPDPLIYDHFPNSPVCFSAWKTPQELPVTQLARHVDLFHLVITNNQRPESLSLPHGLAPPTHFLLIFSQATSLWVTAFQSGSNKSFFSTRGMVFIQQYLKLLFAEYLRYARKSAHQMFYLVQTERKVKKLKRETYWEESVTFTSSRSLLGRGDLRGTLGHQSNTLRGARACLSYRLGIFNLLWQEKVGWRGMVLGKMIGKVDGGMGGSAGHQREGPWDWAGMLFSEHSSTNDISEK